MRLRRGPKALAVVAVLVVIMGLRKPTATRSAGRSRTTVPHKAAARLKGCRAWLSCTAKAVRIPDPTALNGLASPRSIWR